MNPCCWCVSIVMFMKYSQEFQADYHTPQTFGKSDVTFDPEKIRKTLGYVTYVTETVEEENIDTDMDS